MFTYNKFGTVQVQTTVCSF